MQNLRNSVRLIGRLGANPEVKELTGGNKLAKFTVATSDSYKNDKGEKVTNTQWHNLVAWGSQAEFIEKYLKKGAEVAIEGRIGTRNYTDKDGNKKYFTEITVNEMLMVGGKQE